MLDLHFTMRYVAVLQVRGEIRVAGEAYRPQLVRLDPGPQALAFRTPVIQHREVWTLGHQHNAVKAQVRGLVDELIERKKRLAPKAGIAHGVEKKRSHFSLVSKPMIICDPNVNTLYDSDVAERIPWYRSRQRLPPIMICNCSRASRMRSCSSAGRQ